MSLKTIRVTIVCANGLKSVALFGKNQPVAVAWVTAPATRSTRVAVDGGSDPVWNEELAIPVDDALLRQRDSVLKIQVFHRALRYCNWLIGTVYIPIADVVNEPENESPRVVTYPVRGLLRRKHGTLSVILRVEGKEFMSMVARGSTSSISESGASSSSSPAASPPPSTYQAPASSKELAKTGPLPQASPASGPQFISSSPRPVAAAPPLPPPRPIPQAPQMEAVQEETVETPAESSTAIPAAVPIPHAQMMPPPQEAGLSETPPKTRTPIPKPQAAPKSPRARHETSQIPSPVEQTKQTTVTSKQPTSPELSGPSITSQPKIKDHKTNGRKPEPPCVLFTGDEESEAAAHEYMYPQTPLYPKSPYQPSPQYPMALYPQPLYPPELYELVIDEERYRIMDAQGKNAM